MKKQRRAGPAPERLGGPERIDATSKKLVAPDASTDSYFGFSVALDGSYALISSLKENAGKGYLFIRNYGGVNNWGYVKELSQPAIGTGSLLYTSNAGAKHSVNFRLLRRSYACAATSSRRHGNLRFEREGTFGCILRSNRLLLLSRI